jgi:hypothetical protein
MSERTSSKETPDMAENTRTAAIVCREIAVDRAPILYAVKSVPVEPTDSGWQFLCGATEEDPHTAKIWALYEVLEYDPSLKPFIQAPPGTVLRRSSPRHQWEVSHEDETT